MIYAYENTDKTVSTAIINDLPVNFGIAKIDKKCLPSGFETLDLSCANLRKSLKRYAWKHSSYKKH